MSGNSAHLVCCWMYAFTKRMQDAWLVLLSNIHQHLPTPHNEPFVISFLDRPEDYHHSNFLFGQTCGYPYITRLYKTHDVVCAPEFNIEGSIGGQYSSWFITRKNSDKTKLEEFRGSTAVINNTDSNSGMNVLRYAVSKFACSRTFFHNVIVSDSHLSSMKLVEEGAADIAAIDVNTYYFAKSEGKIDENALKIIGQSEHTMGPPFIIRKSLNIDKVSLIKALNKTLKTVEPQIRETLCINQFIEVNHKDYLYTYELKQQAKNLGYPLLR